MGYTTLTFHQKGLVVKWLAEKQERTKNFNEASEAISQEIPNMLWKKMVWYCNFL